MTSAQGLYLFRALSSVPGLSVREAGQREVRARAAGRDARRAMGCCFSVEVQVVETRVKPKQQKSPAAPKPGGNGADSSSSHNHHGSATPRPGHPTKAPTAQPQAAQPEPAMAACNSGGSSGRSGTGSLRTLKRQELEQGTGRFSERNIVGEGSFGKVFKGTLTIGGIPTPIAVKVFNKEGLQVMKDFMAEVSVLHNCSHPNLVKLLGYCVEKTKAMLVYEHCENGSLRDRILPDKRNVPAMTWGERVKVMQGVGRALKYLHENKTVHRNLKLSNILLDRDNTPKVSDFGMAKLLGDEMSTTMTSVMGTMGYLDPAYMETGILRDKSDVYSFGVIMLELLSGKKAQDRLTDWFNQYLFPTTSHPSQWMDKALDNRYSSRGALQAAAIAKLCIDPLQTVRPDMEQVLEDLNLVRLD